MIFFLELLNRITLMSQQFHRLDNEGHSHVTQMTYAIALALEIQLPNRGPDWLKETMTSSIKRDYEETYIDPGIYLSIVFVNNRSWHIFVSNFSVLCNGVFSC